MHHSINIMSLVADAVILVILVAFILTAFRDIARIGTGISRAWAVGRTTFIEAWHNRMWAIPIIWMVICLILGFSIVRGYTPGSEVRVYLTIFIRAQEIILLVYLGILACLSLPRERERKTLITTGAKPVTRLELLLGKIMGLGAAALVMLLAMMLFTWAFMKVVDHNIRSDAMVLYKLEKKNYNRLIRHVPPDFGLLYTATHGVLQAQNYITGKLRIAGMISYATNPPTRYLKGGSTETVYFEFPSIPANLSYQPDFLFRFGLFPPGHPAEIHITAIQRENPMVTEEASVKLNAAGAAAWTPKHPFRFFAYTDPQTGRVLSPGPVVLRVTCPTFHTYLQIGDGTHLSNCSCIVTGVNAAMLHEHGIDYILPKADPVITGFKSNGWQEITGPGKTGQTRPEVASWEFTHLNPLAIPKTKNGKFTLHLICGVSKQTNEAIPNYAALFAYSSDDPTNPVKLLKLHINEKRVTVVHLPERLLDGSPLIVNLSSIVHGHWLKIRTNSVRIMQKPSSFMGNLFKTELIVFCEIILLITIGVVSGTALGWPVALLTTMCCYILGNLFHFVSVLAKANGFELLNIVQEHRLQGVWYYQLGSFISGVMVHVLEILVYLLPNFTRFSPLPYITASRNMPWLFLGQNIFAAMISMIPAIAVGYLVMRKRELS
ncbi:MAG: ABC transporter permease [Phycisphaerae bacterium]